MSTCPNCYNTSTSTPCSSVGCLSINYAKCIFYSGPSLTCEFGGIGSFTFTGVSAGATSETLIFNSQGGSGTGATFAVTTTLGSTEYQVAVVNPGSGYTEGDVLTIPFTFANALSSNWEDITANWEDILDTFGGTSSPGNSITLTVTAVAGVVNNGDNLDNVIRDLHERICLISSNGVQGLDYSGFDYKCLRQGGVLTGVGTTITSASEFTEATAAALCTLNDRIKLLEAPFFTVPSCLSSVLVSNSSSLSSILTEYGNLLCIHNTNLDLSSVGLAPPCINYAFTTTPTSNNVADYVNWITANMCGMFNSLQDDISAESARINALYTYITGATAGTVPASIDTSCLTGGSTSMSLKNAVVLIKDSLCALTTTVNGLSNPTLNIDWSCVYTVPYLVENSPYSNLGSFTNNTTLSQHLSYIMRTLKALKMKFSLSQFTLTQVSDVCGQYWDISLKPEQTLPTSGTVGDLLGYTGTIWDGFALDIKINGSTTGVTKTTTLGPNKITFDLAIPAASNLVVLDPLTSSVSAPWTIPTGWSNATLGITSYTPSLQILHQLSNRITFLQNGFLVKLATSSAFPIIQPGLKVPLYSHAGAYSPASFYGDAFTPTTILKFDSSNTLLDTHEGLIVVQSTTASLATISLMFLESFTPSNTDYFIFSLGNITWRV